MESIKQEKKNLLEDNPVAKVASGGSWMSKHVSPISMGHSMEKGSAAYMKGDLDKDGKMSEYESKRQAAIEKNM
jgi:hypothetical protein